MLIDVIIRVYGIPICNPETKLLSLLKSLLLQIDMLHDMHDWHAALLRVHMLRQQSRRQRAVIPCAVAGQLLAAVPPQLHLWMP